MSQVLVSPGLSAIPSLRESVELTAPAVPAWLAETYGKRQY